MKFGICLTKGVLDRFSYLDSVYKYEYKYVHDDVEGFLEILKF